MKSLRKAQTAISLFEMMIVLVIISILLILTFPSFTYFFYASQNKILQNQLIEALTFAQHETRIRNIPIVLCNSKDGKRCSTNNGNQLLVFINEKKDGVLAEKGDLRAVFPFALKKGKLHWRSFPFYRDYFIFLPNGYADNGAIWFCASRQTQPDWAIFLSREGKIRIAYPDIKNNILDPRQQALSCT